jgi:hypothetical protein
MIHRLSRLNSELLCFHFVGANPKDVPERAVAQQAGDNEDNRQGQQDIAEYPRYHIKNKEDNKQCCQQQPDDLVSRTHVLFHGQIFFVKRLLKINILVNES